MIDYAQPNVNEIRASMIRVATDFSATPIKAEIADVEQAQFHPALRDSSSVRATWKLAR